MYTNEQLVKKCAHRASKEWANYISPEACTNCEMFSAFKDLYHCGDRESLLNAIRPSMQPSGDQSRVRD